jgi:O-antigen ligase
MSRNVKNFPAVLVLALAFLNITGMLGVFTRGAVTPNDGTSLFFYALATPASIYLLVRHARFERIGDLFAAFISFMCIFLAASIGYSLASGSMTEFAVVVAVVYIFQMLFISSIYFWAIQLDDGELVSCFVLLRNFLLISCLGVLMSPLFMLHSSAETERVSGFFADQNLAAFGALLCVVLVVAFPPANRGVAIFQAALALTALFFTFSRTGFLVLIVLAVFYFSTKPFKAWPVYIVAFVLVFFSISLAIELGYLQMGLDQTERLSDIFAILSGEMPRTRYEFRDILYDTGLEKIKQQFPLGSGIGSFHSLEFGVRHRSSGHWLGVHNTYIMIAGEAGLAGVIAFVLFCIKLTNRVHLPSQYRQFSIGATLVIACSMLTTHSVLNDKIAAGILSLVMVTASRPYRNSVPAQHPRARMGG